MGDTALSLREEQLRLDSIASLVGRYISMEEGAGTREENGRKTVKQREEWEIVLGLLEKIDPRLCRRIFRKMLNHLCRLGIGEARTLLSALGPHVEIPEESSRGEQNRPSARISDILLREMDRKIFDIARRYISSEEISEVIQKWVRDDKIAPLVGVLENRHSTIAEIREEITRYHGLSEEKQEISPLLQENARSLLVSRLLTEQLDYVRIAKNHIDIDGFHDILRKTISPPNSQGKLGGKGAGLIISSHILKKDAKSGGDIRIPNTWFVTSDALQAFMSFNDLEDIFEQKFKLVEQVREEYPNITQIFKNSKFPMEIINGLSLALDDLGEVPIIVRSSSLLEDRLGTAFSGKYKSLFLANRGSRQERLALLMDAVAEVYASTFGPDPIEYRKERDLIDYIEEMGVMIQEVIGRQVGKYYFPAFSGVAFSSNEFRWSPRIERTDGLIRMVPGLGTRAVDRLSNDYPRLISPGKPELGVNVTTEELVRYSPRFMDVIDLEENTFRSVPVTEVLREYGDSFPIVEKLVSVYTGDQLADKPAFAIDFEADDMVFTFNGVIRSTPFIATVKNTLDTLSRKLETPVDIEFACDGTDFYLLQCRPQSYSRQAMPSPIPRDIPEPDILFTADQYVSNGLVPDITHIVYVDPEGYGSARTVNELERVGRAISRLNSLLPKRRFILMGPGRWGSRGDIKLGVKVAYSDINCTAMLIEIAMKKGNYTPDLSFGTHFFQDLVESGIRYLPLYPDNDNVVWNDPFFRNSTNMLKEIVPEYGDLSRIITVVDVSREREGKVLRVLQNADLNAAIAFIAPPGSAKEYPTHRDVPPQETSGVWWKWRMEMAEKIAEEMDFERYGVQAVYLIGSVKNASAGPRSDIDLLIHVRESSPVTGELSAWLDGWSLCLGRMNYLRTGYLDDRLLDVHIITDDDISKKTSFAVKIGAVTDPALRLR